MKAWLFQDHKQKQKLGDKCPWSVGWFEDGKKRSKTVGAKSLAEKYARKIVGQAEAGVLNTPTKKTWEAFTSEWRERIGPNLAPRSLECSVHAIDVFRSVVKPHLLVNIRPSDIDKFISIRRGQKGKKKGGAVSVATINKELRHIKAVLGVAKDWGYIQSVPKFRMLREPKKLPRYVIAEHFAAMYGAVNAANLPSDTPECWWRAVLVFARMTGWRIGEIISLRWDDVDLEIGTAITRSSDNKGKRDELVPMHDVVIEHIRLLPKKGKLVMPWPHNYRTLWVQFAKIQTAAGINLPCAEAHEHTPACHLYGFHDLRRAFATENADRITSDSLQTLMRHKSYQTTQKYINLASQVRRSVDNLSVPDVLRKVE